MEPWTSCWSCTGDSLQSRPSEDATQTLAQRDELIVAHLEWARGIARNVARCLPTWFTADDLTGPAEIALIEVAAKYDPDRGVPFRSFAHQRIYGACFDSARRREYRERAHRSLSDCADTGYSANRGSESRHEIQALDNGPSP